MHLVWSVFKRHIKCLNNLRTYYICAVMLAAAISIARRTVLKLSARIAGTVLLNYLHISYPSAGGGRTSQQTRGSTALWGPGLPIYHAIHFPWRLHMFRLQMNARVENGSEIYWQPPMWRERTCTQLIAGCRGEKRNSGNGILAQLVPLFRLYICVYFPLPQQQPSLRLFKWLYKML